MANYSALIATINEYIKTNGAGEITGQVLNNVLNNMVTALGANYTYGGVAIPSTNPETPTTNVFYLASHGGTYSHFGGFTFKKGLSLLAYNGTAWDGQQLLTFDDADVSSAKGVFSSSSALNAAYPNPLVGWFAYVGNALPMTLYKCEQNGTWINGNDNIRTNILGIIDTTLM